jgi:hypothetical protein
MPRNQKLTKVIASRKIKAVTNEPGSVLVLFERSIKHEGQDNRTCNDTTGRQDKIRP